MRISCFKWMLWAVYLPVYWLMTLSSKMDGDAYVRGMRPYELFRSLIFGNERLFLGIFFLCSLIYIVVPFVVRAVRRRPVIGRYQVAGFVFGCYVLGVVVHFFVFYFVSKYLTGGLVPSSGDRVYLLFPQFLNGLFVMSRSAWAEYLTLFVIWSILTIPQE